MGSGGQINGNALTKQMLESTQRELLKASSAPSFKAKKVVAEQSVLIQKPKTREGRFDFLIESLEGKFIGVEVLTRPSKGKLKEKLAYAKTVDEFIFVLPANCLELYKKKKKTGLHQPVRKKFFPKEFGPKKIFVWLFDPKTEKFFSKKVFSKEFNVE